ncbi:MAG: BNR-4 repeat-containing protein [Phycisphaerae bacterium]|nr:BNR-4 repeat-containing protein [Phycisphaerae bacterium]
MSNKIVTVGDKTYVSWLDTKAVIRLQAFDHRTGQAGDALTIGQGVDNHSGPALTVDGEGNLHVVFGPHGGPFQYRHTTRPGDMGSWSTAIEFGKKCTYPSLVCSPDGTLHVTCREGSHPCNLHYYRKPVGGEWAGPVDLVDPDVKTGYTQFGNPLAVASDGALHLAFHIYDLHPAAGKAVGYMRSKDGGRSWTDSKGRVLSLPVTPKTAELIESDPKFDMRVGNVAVDGQSHPWFMSFHHEMKPNDAMLWRHDGQAWRKTSLVGWVRKTVCPSAQIAGGALAFGGDGRLYVALGIVTGKPGWGAPTSEIALLVSADGGRTFTGQMISPPDPKTPNWLPSIERCTEHNGVAVPWLIYTHGQAGEGCMPKDVTEIRLVALAGRSAGKARKTVRVGGIVAKWTPKDRERSYARVEPMIRQAAAGGAEIVCTTESFLDGYSIRDKEMPIDEFRALGEEIPGGPYVTKLQALAKELKIYLIAGLLRRIGEKTYNSAVVIGPNGEIIGVYHKQHLGHETVRNTAGTECPTFETPWGRMGVMICADRRYPEVTAGLVKNGAKFIIVPSGGMWGPKSNDHHVRARSKQSNLPIVFVHPIEWLVTGPGGVIWDRDFRGNLMDVRPEQVDTAADQKGVFLFDLPVGGRGGSGVVR